MTCMGLDHFNNEMLLNLCPLRWLKSIVTLSSPKLFLEMTRRVSQVIERLPSTHEALSSNPQNCQKGGRGE
jgi:hypothetical protein